MRKSSNQLSFGVLCLPYSGHLYPMLSLCLEMKSRGYRIVLFYYIQTDFISKLNQYGIETIAACSETDSQLLFHESKVMGRLAGWKANKQNFYLCDQLAKINFKNLPEKIKHSQCDALLIDQCLIEGESIASSSGLPFINICNALMLNPDLGLPPAFMGWRIDSSVIGWIRNFFGYLYVKSQSGKHLKLIRGYRKNNKLSPYPSSYDQSFFTYLWSDIATIAQQPKEFEFPRSTLAENFYFSGPFINPELREEVDFPWEKLNGKPLIYASLGTLQNSIEDIFTQIAEACIGLDHQLVISLGKSNMTGRKTNIKKLPAESIVVNYAPQLKLLQRANLCITHAGLNTTLESLSNGVPMVAIPIANDQPGVGARIEWTGTGKVVKYTSRVEELRKAITEVLSNNSYRQNALKIKQKIESSEGAKRAADIIETKMKV